MGPLENLEAYVPPDWWRRIFNSLYLKTDSDVVEDPTITRSEVDWFSQLLNLSLDEKILDLCCGQGRHSLELARRGFTEVEGFDRSHFLIQKARSISRKEGLPIRFREGDARKLPYRADSFQALLILGNSFGYFETPEEDVNVLKDVFRVLRPQGKLLIDISDGDFLRKNFQARTWEWIDAKHFVCRERALSADGKRLISREVITHSEKGVLADQFYAERLYGKMEIQELLRSIGFSDIVVHGKLETPSQRNQDLGMMAQRLILTATVRKDWSPVKTRAKVDKKTVAVYMGDPKRLDPLKPDSVFDEDDIYTIDRLKEALYDLKGYQFTYLDDHALMIQGTSKLKGKIDFVLNLCDEGFDNNPFKELHVPALLEIADIPFTGAGPQCLAYCYDKSLVRGVAKEMDIPVPEAFFVNPGAKTFETPFPFPMILKPNFGDSSFGITQNSVVHNIEQLLNEVIQLHKKFGYDKPILVEQYLTGNDVTLGIIGNPDGNTTILPICEEDYSDLPADLPRICGYEAKWDPQSPYARIKSIPAKLPPNTEKLMAEASLRLFERLGCRDYARFDWRLDAEGTPRLLEVNPNPGWCWDGKFNLMAGYAGLRYADLLRLILEAGQSRYRFQGEEEPV
ncbi:MAG: methyltransferase domain-containing protein [bacterium]|nr:methyltransferase domain-containing protein [bacterium]